MRYQKHTNEFKLEAVRLSMGRNLQRLFYAVGMPTPLG